MAARVVQVRTQPPQQSNDISPSPRVVGGLHERRVAVSIFRFEKRPCPNKHFHHFRPVFLCRKMKRGIPAPIRSSNIGSCSQQGLRDFHVSDNSGMQKTGPPVGVYLINVGAARQFILHLRQLPRFRNGGQEAALSSRYPPSHQLVLR